MTDIALTNPPLKNGLVYVVDDNEAIRDSLSLLLDANGYSVICHESAEGFLHALDSSDQKSLSCALIDIHLAGMSGIELQEELLAKRFYLPIAFITGHGEISIAVKALKKGACDFIQKPINEEALFVLIREMLLKARLNKEQSAELKEIHARFKPITRRELAVLDQIAAGKTNKEISVNLGISMRTVEAHRSAIMKKLNVRRATNLLQLTLKYQEALNAWFKKEH